MGKIREWVEISRPFALTATAIPVLLGTVMAWGDGFFQWDLLAASLVAAVLLQVATNIINEVYDFRRGVDTLDTPRPSRVIVEGRLTVREAYRGALALLASAAAVGAYLVYHRGWPMMALGLVGLVTGYFYTAEPVSYKYRGLGVPMVFLLMGPLMVSGTYFVQAGFITGKALLISVPVGCLVAAILHSNDLRDSQQDSAAGITTLAAAVGPVVGGHLYAGLVFGSFAVVALLVLAGVITPWALAVYITLPLALGQVKSAWRGRQNQRALDTIDVSTAQLHLFFGLLLLLSVFFSTLFA